jgi:catechol 2,3-dioxygenase-like lactoylglutathione lyase family enzyme
VRRLFQITLLVADYNEARDWFVSHLGFSLKEDTDLGGGKRWVVLSTGHGGGADLLLARADGDAQQREVGKQAGGRVGFFLQTDDFDGDCARFSKNGVQFLETPRHESYGKVVQFADLYGNKWDLIEPASS